MGNGSLVYGSTLDWEDVIILVKKYIENHEVFDNLDFKQNLIQWQLWMEGDWRKKTDWDFKTYGQEANKIVATISGVEMQERLQSIIDKYFTEDAFAPDSDLSEIEFYKIISLILGLSCCSNGSCCNHDLDVPFVVGFVCKGGPCRGEASGAITMITDAQKEKVEKILGLIGKEAFFMINSDDCDSCT